VVGFRAVGERGLALRGLLVLALLGVLAGLQLPAASGAGSPSSLRGQADALRAESGSLDAQARAAWLSVVSLGTRLEQSQAALLRLQARTERVAAERAEAELRLRVARKNLKISEQRLAARLRELYVQGDSDPIAVVLGSGSIAEAIEALDSFDRVAVQDRRVLDAAKGARAKLVSVTRALAAREAEARQAQAAAAATAAALAGARAEQTRLLAGLRAEARASSAQATSLDAQARALAAAQAAAAPQGTPALPAPPAAGGRTLTVNATGYALAGRTATGVSVGWGVVAVDPGVIPLGTRMSIPGYGEGVAADTGGAVRGAHIDLWFPTQAEALAWGSRTITITLL
jgi:3D (Asp-Asp-Asp) domain-containing protein/septal ring factor EnvC (AmiA/AmiB activator)